MDTYKFFVFENTEEILLLPCTRFQGLSKFMKPCEFEIIQRKPIETIQDKDFLLDPDLEGA
jgi:hypothetical protein